MNRLAVLLAAALASEIALASDDDSTELSPAGSLGRLARIVRPDYPPEALARGLTGVVEIEGHAQPSGFVGPYTYRPDKPESAVFVDALKRVIRGWRWILPLDNDCQPSAKPLTAQVSFEIENHTPHIFVTHAKAEESKPVPPHRRAKWRETIVYPPTLSKFGMTAYTFAKVTVDRSGHVTDVVARSYPRYGTPPDKLPVFNEAAESALREWIFPPVPAEYPAPWVGCYNFTFRLGG